jgi:ATP-dependent DNA ligase
MTQDPMKLPIPLTTEPMEAASAATLPVGPQWQYEPKWDGFRCLAFRDQQELGHGKIELQSKSGKPLTRYFPELVAALGKLPTKRFVLDGEIVIPADGNFSFDQLLMRIHPSGTRVEKLSRETPARFIIFDLLVNQDGKSLMQLPLAERRPRLERFASRYLKRNRRLRLSPFTLDISTARAWFHMGTSVDGVVAKRRDMPYQSGTRNGMQKIKKMRTADCVVGGFRYLEKEPLVGSLLLGLYNDQGALDHVGFTSSISAETRPGLTRQLEKLIRPPGFTGKAPGGPSRWSTKRSSEWQPLSPKLVVEVQFDHFTGGRFRHGTKFLRWRPDKKPAQCTTAQVEREHRSALNLL